MRLRTFAVVVVAIAAGFAASRAEIVKTAIPDCKTNQICFYWWPKLPQLTGWHSDDAVNYSHGGNGMNALIPDGRTFGDAPAIIYAMATYKERYDWENNTKSTLDSFISDDKATFKDAEVAEVAPLKTADGQTLRVFTYFRAKDKTWECVAYGIEDDDYLTFVLSANSEDAYKQNLPVFQDLISRYRR